MQEIAVSLIMIVAVAWTGWNLYRQLSGKKQCNCADGKGHCGCKPRCQQEEKNK